MQLKTDGQSKKLQTWLIDRNIRDRAQALRRDRGLELERAVAGAYERTVMTFKDNTAPKTIFEAVRPLAYGTASVLRHGVPFADWVVGLGLMFGGVATGLNLPGVIEFGGGVAMFRYRPITEVIRVGAIAAGYGGERVANIVNAIMGKSEPAPKPAAA
ncbi:hypothetical protein HY032_03025 [Candidatus Gottesmanbacteria bacterium]|nr:hypothetical protein [Candidatus Gottesmanbacteria bacterium]